MKRKPEMGSSSRFHSF